MAKTANFNPEIDSYLKIRLYAQNSILNPKIDSVRAQKIDSDPKNRFWVKNSKSVPKTQFSAQNPMLDPKINSETKIDYELKILILCQKINSLESLPKNRFRP